MRIVHVIQEKWLELKYLDGKRSGLGAALMWIKHGWSEKQVFFFNLGATITHTLNI